MKLLAAIFVLLLTGHALAADLVAERPQRLPPLHDVQLAQVLARHKGSAVIVNFWASWCEPCREEMPSLQRLSDRWRSRGLQVITIAVADRPAAASDFLARTAERLPLVLDPDQRLAQDWGVYMLPASLVLDRQHRIIGSARGAIEWDTAPIDQQLQSLLLQRK